MLVIITPGFPGDEEESTCLPAIQQFILALLEEKNTSEIKIISLQYPFFRKTYKWNNIDVISIGGKNRKGIAKFQTWWRAWHVLKLLKKQNPKMGILALWLTETSLLAKYFSRMYQCPTFFWLQGQDAKASNRYIKFIKPRADQVLAISEFSQNDFEKNHGIKPFTIAENGIRPQAFKPLNKYNRTIDFFAAGSLIKLKNYDMLIEALLELKKSLPHFKAVHAGEGPEEKTLKEKVKQCGLENHLQFLGSQPHEKVLELMNNSRCFIHTSTYEGSSTVLAEALYNGCEVITTIGLGSKKINHLHTVQNVAQMAGMMHQCISIKLEPERITNHLMRDTAKMIIDLYGES